MDCFGDDDDFEEIADRMAAAHARDRRRKQRLKRLETHDLILRERAQARALATRRPDKDQRTLLTLKRRIARLEARLAGAGAGKARWPGSDFDGIKVAGRDRGPAGRPPPRRRRAPRAQRTESVST